MVTELELDDWRYRKVQKWLLLLLRFAVTREPSDQSARLPWRMSSTPWGYGGGLRHRAFFSGRVMMSARQYSRSTMGTIVLFSEGTWHASMSLG
jgi:hypothetical protein